MLHKVGWRNAGVGAPLLFTASLACVGQCLPVIVPSGESPIVIDTRGNWNGGKEQFSDPTKGNYVSFDMRGDGTLQKLSWPLPNKGLAWLVLDRDGDGIIKDGTELFGNFTPHADYDNPSYPNPNGFIALSWYDQPAQGGNQDLILDAKDAIWPKLKLWIDEHCYKEPDKACHSRREELHPLDSANIKSVSMVWDTSPGKLTEFDDVGNDYKFSTVLNPDKGKPKNRKSTDGLRRLAQPNQVTRDARQRAPGQGKKTWNSKLVTRKLVMRGRRGGRKEVASLSRQSVVKGFSECDVMARL